MASSTIASVASNVQSTPVQFQFRFPVISPALSYDSWSEGLARVSSVLVISAIVIIRLKADCLS